ncbi:hypothetical protein DYBT9275_03396 [Dyadobacter sp. CECT 9275]|uniref:Uncharacterized protein n=1 Tax=Dyadobacter helix TaxID=2822344 RepID=A0A916JHK5_9BACT|nr:hypothetical protein [Dyadobacter sp. CECT 9275]CAG5004563.1 hypothetical protein DYBT9275_03396 [Dyadobacter sp. CECT 9275]
MKTIKNSFIFAAVFGILVLTITRPSVAGGLQGTEKLDGTLISKTSEVEFAAYVSQTVPEFIKQGNWSIIERVVTLYGESPSKVRGLGVEEINTFNAAVAQLGNELEKVNSKEALQWRDNLSKTASAIRFVKNFDLNKLTAENLEAASIVKVPVSYVRL